MIEFKNITKEYYGNTVLKDVSLVVKKGEIHGVVGENGAGKTTLMNILFGMPVIQETGGYEGEMLIDGKKINVKSPKGAMDLGIGMIHQEFMLIPGFNITENVKLNREITHPNLLSRTVSQKMETLNIPPMRKDTREALKEAGLGIDELLPVIGLPVGYKQFIEVAREIDKAGTDNLKLLVFDEPTAVLTESEAEKLLDIIRLLAQKGLAILFISHRLDEVIKVSNRVTILRDGEKIGEKDSKETNIMELAELMVGRKLKKLEIGFKDKSAPMNQSVLKIRNLEVDMPGELVKGIDLDVKKGEILGIGGLAGHGKIGITNGVAGLFPARGEVFYNDIPLPLNNPFTFLQRKIAFLSEDRRGVGLLLMESIDTNIGLTAFYVNSRFSRTHLGIKYLNARELRNWSLKMINELDIRCVGPHQVVMSLSGGNQQKICIARALTMEPELLFVSEPTRGIDVGAKQKILELIVKLNKDMGMTVVLTSSELQELRTISDRIAIVHHGKIVDILEPDTSDVDFGLAMAGIRRVEQ